MADLSWAPVTCVLERVGVSEASASDEGLATFRRPRSWRRADGEAGLGNNFEGATPSTSEDRAPFAGAATLPGRSARSPLDFGRARGAGLFSEAGRSMGLAATGAASSHLWGADPARRSSGSVNRELSWKRDTQGSGLPRAGKLVSLGVRRPAVSP